MRPYLISLALLLFCAPAFSQFHYFFSDSSTNPRSVVVAQHIKEDSIFSYTLDGKKIVDSIFIGLEKYNEDGSIALQKQMIGKKGFFTLSSFFYNGLGRLVKQAISGDKGTEPFYINTIGYDSKGLDTGSNTYSRDANGVRNGRARNEYNSAGKLIKKYLQWDDKPMYLAEQYAYDSQGWISQVDNYDEKGTLLYSSLFEYNTARRRMTIYQLRKGEKHKYMIFDYNHNDRCTRISWYLKEPHEYRFLYNADGSFYEYRAEQNGKTEVHRHYYSKE